MPDVGEVEIRGDYLGDHPDNLAGMREQRIRAGIDPDAPTIPPARVLAEIGDHQKRGTRVLLLELGPLNGGCAKAMIDVYSALRNFSRSGGLVVVHVVGRCVSSGPVIAQAGNYVLMNPDATFVIHSTIVDEGKTAYEQARAKRQLAYGNEQMFNLLRGRTFAPPELLRDWLSRTDNTDGRPSLAVLKTDAAIHYGFADRVATREEALAFAAALAGGLGGLVARDAVELTQVEQMRGAIAYHPQVNDGYPENQVTTTQSIVLGTDIGVPYGSVSSKQISTGRSNYHNLWPNPTSELDPPTSVVVLDDGSNVEFDYRANVGANPAAYAGIFVRKFLRTTAGTTALRLAIPASPGESYLFRAQHRWISTGGTPTGSMKLTWLDRDKNALSGAQTANHSTGDTSWTGTDLSIFTAPADTTYIEFALSLTTAASGTAEIRWDALVAFKILSTPDFADLQINNNKLALGASVRAKRSTAQSISHNTVTQVIFTTEDYDSFGTYSSGTFTCPNLGDGSTDGKYSVSASVTLDGTAHDMTDCYLSVFVNGSEFARLDRLQAQTDFVNTHYLQLVTLTGCTTVKLQANDTVDIRVWQSNASAGSISTEAYSGSNWFCIEQLFGPKYFA